VTSAPIFGDSIPAWGSCDPTLNGFQSISETDYVLGPSGEQAAEVAMDANNTMAWAHTNAWAGGKLLATYDPDTLHFYFNDALGTRRVQADYQGVVEEDCASLPFGDEESCLPTPSEHLFTGKERDAESGNDYFGARYYSSAMGRFMSPDWAAKAMPVPYAVMGDPQSLNLYAYVRNNPLSRRDLDGHCAPNTSNPGGWVCMNPRWGIAAPQQQSGFGGAGAGGSWDPAPTQSTTTASSTPSRVKIPGYGGTATVAAGAAPFIPTESPEIGASIPEIPYVNTPFGPAYQGGSEAELGALADAQGGAMLYRSGITGFNSATEGQYWSMMNPTTTEGYTDLMGMPSQVGAEGYPFIVSARLAPGAAAITRFAPAVAGGGTGGALEVVVGDAAEALEVLAFTIP